MHHDRRTQLWIFLFFLALYLLASGDHFTEKFYSSDETLMAMTTVSMVTEHSLRIPETFGTTTPKFGILQSVVAVPFYLLARAVGPHLPRALAEPAAVYLLYCTCAFLTALLLARFYGFSRWLRYPRPAALAATLALGLTTVLFPYARMFFSEPLVALTLLGAVAGVARHGRRGAARPLVYAGAWFALALLARQDNLVLLPAFLLAIAMAAAPRPQPLRRSLRGAALFMIPVAGALVAQLGVNALRYGSPWSSGYGQEAFSTPLYAGLYGLLVSPGRGLLIYSPPLLAVPFLFAGFLRRRRLVALLALWIFVIKLLLFAGWWSWQGGWSWGSRFLLPAIPLLFLAMNELFMRWRRTSGWARAAVLALLALGLAVQALAVLTNPNKHGNDIWAMINLDENQFLFIPQISFLAGNWVLLRTGQIDSFMVHFGERFGWGALAAVVGVLGAMLLVSGWRLACAAGGLGGGKAGWLARLRGMRNVRLESWRARAAAGLVVLNLLIFLLCAGAAGVNRIAFASTAGGGSWHEVSGRVQNRFVMMEETTPARDAAGQPPEYEWRGWLLAPLSGEYVFHLKASGFYRLVIDGQELLVNASEKEQHVRAAKLNLTQGPHAFLLRYHPVAPDYRLLRLYWTAPGGGIYRELVSSRWLFEAEPSGVMLGLIKLDRLKWLVLALSLMAGAALGAGKGDGVKG